MILAAAVGPGSGFSNEGTETTWNAILNAISRN